MSKNLPSRVKKGHYNLTWEPVPTDHEVKYEVYFRAVGEKKYRMVGITDGDNVSVIVEHGKRYEFYVVAMGKGKSQEKSAVCTFTALLGLPAAPINLLAYEQPAIERAPAKSIPNLPGTPVEPGSPTEPTAIDVDGDSEPAGFDQLEAMLTGKPGESTEEVDEKDDDEA